LTAFLTQWERANPLVRAAFRGALNGGVTWPERNAGDENAQGFLRRFKARFGAVPPWATAAGTSLNEQKKLSVKEADKDAQERKQVASNVSKVQSARRDVQDVANSRSYSPVATDNSSRAEQPSGASLSNMKKDALPDRRGWTAWQVEGRWHVLGWVEPAGAGEVRGVELDLTSLISRLAGALPAETNPGEGYALRDDRQRIMHQAGTLPTPRNPVARVPLSNEVLPEWDVVGFLALVPLRSVGGGGIYVVGSLLVGIFIAAILAGGSLLWRQARLSEAEAAQKTSFVANVSHEFKTPLTTIRLYAELLEQGRVRDAAQGGEYLQTIGRETQRLARLVNNALDFSRLEQGRKKFALESLDLTAELTRLLNTHAPRVAEAGLALHRELPGAPVAVTTDRDALEQIMINLLDNACKYAAAGGEVRVSLAARDAGGAEVHVADRGPGVPAAHSQRIFEKFHRVDDRLTAEQSGAGLGLSIARQLARGLGGELRCTSRSGGGADFIFELP
jgi:two-component system, OmpR family, phosphate regulon sensor histidine kinase PhoR